MKNVSLQYGNDSVFLQLPVQAKVLYSSPSQAIEDVRDKLNNKLENPIASKSLKTLASGKRNAVIVVSDNTRPVPYRGKGGILKPIIDVLKKEGMPSITVLIACGTHRPMSDSEIRQMLGECADIEGVKIINHRSDDSNMLRCIGSTKRTPRVMVNKLYLDADLKILTGLVEPHFMAGFSGGRKSICPGICGTDVTYGFHSAKILNDKSSESLNIKTNPCHEEAIEIAQMVGADFIVNVTLNRDKQVNGIFCGDMEEAHMRAVSHLRKTVTIPLKKQYDIVITQAGDVGVNHYQCAKSVVEASKAVKSGGKIILLASLSDPDPLGGENYKSMLKRLKLKGTEEFMQELLANDAQFIPEQWQVQMWCKAYERITSPADILLCAPGILRAEKDIICETDMSKQVPQPQDMSELEYAVLLLEKALLKACGELKNKDILVLPEGPYAVPVLKDQNE
jgi:lactate racemase